MTFSPSIPTGLVKLNQDYLNIQNNFSASNNVFGVDHLPFSNATAQKGYHTSVHMVPQSTPTNSPGYGQIYTTTVNKVNNDQTLFFQTGTGNRNIQLTSNFLPVVSGVTGAANGTLFVPGGFIMMFGFKTSAKNGSGDISLNANGISFPSNCFAVYTQPYYTTGSAPNDLASVSISITDKTSFHWKYQTSSNSYVGFYWWAIGN